MASGRRQPRTSGVIFARAASRAGIDATVAQDSFIRAGVAEYEAIEFLPSR